MAKILMTGYLGFIGSLLSTKLVELGHEVIGVDDRSYSQLDNIEGVKDFNNDVNDIDIYKDELESSDCLIHLAAISGVAECDKDKEKTNETNVLATKKLLKVCSDKKIPLIFPCSMAVFGNSTGDGEITEETSQDPTNLYGKSKYESEQDIIQEGKKSDFPYYILIKSNIYGAYELQGKQIEKGNVVTLFVNKIKNKDPITIFKPGTQKRNFIHVKDVVDIYIKAIDDLLANKGQNVLNVGGIETLSVVEVAGFVEDAAEAAGYEPVIELLENPRNEITSDFIFNSDKMLEKLNPKFKELMQDNIKEMFNQ